MIISDHVVILHAWDWHPNQVVCSGVGMAKTKSVDNDTIKEKDQEHFI